MVIGLSKEVDVLVVGGGPAGVISAYTAAKEGYNVLLIDAKRMEEIGKKTCGDALDLRAPSFLKEKLGLELPHGDEVSDLVEYLVMQTPNGELSIRGDGFVVDRHIYGKRLLKEAKNVGVEILPRHKVRKALVEDHEKVVGVEALNLDEKKTVQIKARVTIDCSGRNHVVRKTLPETQFPYLEKKMNQKDIVASYREIIQLKTDHNYHRKIYLIYEPEIPAPGYLWIFTKGPYKLNVGVGWHMRGSNKAKDMKKIYQDAFKKYYTPDQYEIIDGAGYTIPTRYPMLNAVAHGFLTAGDAAFHVDPFTAEGHGPALIAGYYAGRQAALALDSGGEPTMERLWEYNINVMNHFGKQHCKNQIFTAVLNKVGLETMDFLFKRNIFTTEDFVTLNEGRRPSLFSLLVKIIKMFPKYYIISHMNTIVKASKKIDALFEQYPKDPKDFANWQPKLLELMAKYGRLD